MLCKSDLIDLPNNPARYENGKGPSSLLYAESGIRWLILRLCSNFASQLGFHPKFPRIGFNFRGGRGEPGLRQAMPCGCVSWGKSQSIEYLLYKKVLENGVR